MSHLPHDDMNPGTDSGGILLDIHPEMKPLHQLSDP